jgi:hypothetical protein
MMASRKLRHFKQRGEVELRALLHEEQQESPVFVYLLDHDIAPRCRPRSALSVYPPAHRHGVMRPAPRGDAVDRDNLEFPLATRFESHRRLRRGSLDQLQRSCVTA